LAKPPAGFPRGVTSSEASSPAIDQPPGKNAAAKQIDDVVEKKRPLGQRVLDGLSGVRVGGRLQAAPDAALLEKRN
jgi:hypothetical protein